MISRIIRTTGAIKFCITSAFLFSSCGFFKNYKTPKASITEVKVTQAFPNINDKGKFEGQDTSTSYIYYNKNMILYKLPYQYTSYHSNNAFNDITLDTSETRYHFFVYKKGDSVGCDYDSHKHPQGIRLTTDSISKHEWVIHNNNVYPIIHDNNGTLISRNQNKDSGTLNELYSFKRKKDSILVDGRVFLEYANVLKNIPYSLSKQLDSITKMKLIKLTMLTDLRSFKNPDVIIDSFEISRWISKIPSNEGFDEAAHYFEKYEKDMHLQKNN